MNNLFLIILNDETKVKIDKYLCLQVCNQMSRIDNKKKKKKNSHISIDLSANFRNTSLWEKSLTNEKQEFLLL